MRAAYLPFFGRRVSAAVRFSIAVGALTSVVRFPLCLRSQLRAKRAYNTLLRPGVLSQPVSQLSGRGLLILPVASTPRPAAWSLFSLSAAGLPSCRLPAVGLVCVPVLASSVLVLLAHSFGVLLPPRRRNRTRASSSSSPHYRLPVLLLGPLPSRATASFVFIWVVSCISLALPLSLNRVSLPRWAPRLSCWGG